MTGTLRGVSNKHCLLSFFFILACIYWINMSLVMRNPAFCICENKDADQLAVTAKLISAFVLAILLVQPLYYLNPKFQAYNYLLCP